MTIQRNRYPAGTLARGGRAAGSAVLVFPFAELWHQFVSLFLALTVRCIASTRERPPMAELHERHGLTKSALDLSEFFDGYGVRLRTMPTTAAGLQALGQCADDLAREDGQWKQDARELDVPARDAREKLSHRIAGLVSETQRDHGFPNAKSFLEKLEHLFHSLVAGLETVEPLYPDRLREVANRFRTAAQPRNVLIRWALRVWPNLSPRHWLSEPERTTLERSLLPELNRAATVRYAGELARAKRSVLQKLLGDDRAPGELHNHWKEINRREVFFAELDQRRPDHARADRFHEVPIVDNLNAVLDPATKLTLEHFWLDQSAAAGSSPEGLANRLLKHGLGLQGRSVRPSEWPSYDPAELRRALRLAAEIELGSADPHRPLAAGDPQSPVERIAAFGLIAPEYRLILNIAVERWIAVSRPYCLATPLTGHEPVEKTYLFCYPPDRKAWLRLIDGRVPFLDPAVDPLQAADYATAHPFVAILHQAQYGIPLGSLAGLTAWRRALIAQRRENELPILHDHRSCRELGVIATRPDDIRDAAELVRAAELARVLVPVPESTDRLALARPDNRLDAIFAPVSRTPKWLFEDDVVRLLQDPTDRHELFVGFSNLNPAHLAQWVDSPDAKFVCSELVKAGVLEAGTHRLYRLCGRDGFAGILNAWHDVEPGPMAGLTRAEITNVAYWNIVLYSVLFYGVFDAFEEQRLSPNDVPKYLLETWKRASA